MFYFSKKVRLFSQNDVLFLFYFLINPTMTTAAFMLSGEAGQGFSSKAFKAIAMMIEFRTRL